MATIATITPTHAQPEYLPPAGAAPTYDRELRRAAKGLKASLTMLAYYGARMRAGDLFSSLGYNSEDEYRESLGVPRSTWFKYIRIGELLYDLSLDDLQAISTGNAELLIQVDPMLRLDYDWVTEAKQLTCESFAELISKRNRQTGAPREPQTYFRAKVPYSVKKFLEESLENFRVKNELTSTAQALEFLIAERHDTPTILETLQQAQGLLRVVLNLLERRQIPEFNEEFYLIKKSWRLIREARQETISRTNQAAGVEDDEERE